MMLTVKERAAFATLYSEPHRRYHDFRHILWGESEMEQYAADNPLSAAEANIWALAWPGHDVIYNPRSTINELRSASLITNSYKDDSRFTPLEISVASEIILLTNHVSGIPLDPAWRRIAEVVLDIDLSSLGAPWHIFYENSTDIRFEYKFVPITDYRTGRRRILRSFLDRDRIYYTEYFHEKYETQARENLRVMLDRYIDIMP